MTVTYGLCYDDRYVVTALQRHRALAKSRWLRWPIKIFCSIGLAALLGLLVAIKAYAAAIVPLAFLALLAAAPQFDYLVLRHKFRQHAQFGSREVIEFLEGVIRSESNLAKSEYRWTSFTKAAGFSDGLLLYLAPWHYIWLPDSALQRGDAVDARAFVARQVKNYGRV